MDRPPFAARHPVFVIFRLRRALFIALRAAARFLAGVAKVAVNRDLEAIAAGAGSVSFGLRLDHTINLAMIHRLPRGPRRFFRE